MECVGSLQSQCTVDEGEEGAGGGRRGQEGEGEGRRGTERAGGAGGDGGQEGDGEGRRGQEGDGEGRRGRGGRRGQERQEGACRRGMGDSNNTPQASLQVVRITVLPPYQVNNAIAAIRTPNNYINYI